MERHFDHELATLKNDLRHMGSLVQQAAAKAMKSLQERDKESAQEVVREDAAIDALELRIDELSLDLLALRQPMAYDLRFITMAMKINTDLERMADLAVDIAQRVLEIADEPLVKPLIDLPRLETIVKRMVGDVLESFVKEDANLAREVITFDADANALRDRIQAELITDYMMKDRKTVRRSVALLLIARYLERIADHATNIAEDVIYMVQAKVVKHGTERLPEA